MKEVASSAALARLYETWPDEDTRAAAFGTDLGFLAGARRKKGQVGPAEYRDQHGRRYWHESDTLLGYVVPDKLTHEVYENRTAEYVRHPLPAEMLELTRGRALPRRATVVESFFGRWEDASGTVEVWWNKEGDEARA